MGFKRPPHDRDLAFDEIAQMTLVPADQVRVVWSVAFYVTMCFHLLFVLAAFQVELLLMRGLSLKLIRGDIDEKSRIFYMSWVKPRVLNMEQVRCQCDCNPPLQTADCRLDNLRRLMCLFDRVCCRSLI